MVNRRTPNFLQTTLQTLSRKNRLQNRVKMFSPEQCFVNTQRTMSGRCRPVLWTFTGSYRTRKTQYARKYARVRLHVFLVTQNINCRRRVVRLVRSRYVRPVATDGRLEQRHRKSPNMARVVSVVETKTKLKDDVAYDVNIVAVSGRGNAQLYSKKIEPLVSFVYKPAGIKLIILTI